MTKVLITESYLEDIADSIRAKNGTQNMYKPSEMASAIDAISGGGITPTGTKQISITQNGTTTEDVTNYASAEINVNVSAPSPTLQTKSVSYTPTTSAQSATVTADNGYDGLSSVSVSVSAMATGTEGTPTATKGTVSNNSVSVTPAVTNVAGYISGGTKTGTAVTVSASELVSGSLSITTNDTYDVTNYASAIVNVSGGGGGSNISLLGTVTVTSDTREFDIDLTDYQSYNFFFVFADVTLSASDWLYYVKNGSTASGGNYDNSLITHKFIIGAQLNPVSGGDVIVSGTSSFNTFNLGSGAMTNLYVYTYASNKTIKAGSTFKIYGGNYADL